MREQARQVGRALGGRDRENVPDVLCRCQRGELQRDAEGGFGFVYGDDDRVRSLALR